MIGVAIAFVLGMTLWVAARDWVFQSDGAPGQEEAIVQKVACGAQSPPPARALQYERPPKPTLKAKADYWAIIRTSCGDMKVNLLEGAAPAAVNNFVFLAQQGFYDGLLWHHVTPDFIIQTGDPNGVNGNPPDGPGYTISDELPKKRREYVFGSVGFANSGAPDSSGSQFFIVVHDLAGALKGEPSPLEIDRTYTIFGRVPKRYFGSIQEITQQPLMGGTDPVQSVRTRLPVYLNSIEIVVQP